MLELTPSQVRAAAVAAQGLHTSSAAQRTPLEVLRALGCIQIDTINVVRRSHELVMLARGVPSDAARAYASHEDKASFFEYWAHAAAFTPVELWPLFAFRRRRTATHGWRGPAVDPEACAEVRRLADERGSVTISDLGGAGGNRWERGSPRKWAAEWLWATGELVCVRRLGWKRVYEPVERALPEHLRADAPDDDACLRGLTGIALRNLGVATAEDVADYFRLPAQQVRLQLERLPQARPVRVEGWPDSTWAHTELLEHGETAVDEERVTPLSPFDSLIWTRPRMRRLFGVEYLLEAYKPAATRECGYFGLPVLAGDRVVGRVALRARSGKATLEGRQVTDPAWTHAVDTAAQVAAAWANATVEQPTATKPH
ncbi:crosslink repair DNA glycosylase YcaQ family protein [Streptomyces ficellus]|uniref:Crosslink repair DNA glycosylase YcaQ family protein n=1 Tax=Streptomyces ficellus TaxID=1977088 RepID=A0ABT7ZAQ7_9ACTN|nr:crosslink repair DNA glycosylase YcaQ family protein [Streptomyces ficellus]MDN3296601.1 crosslink repair DNA glycosylase YcaQ family protein [Streptomyces ficellus]